MPRDVQPEWVEGCDDCLALEGRWEKAGIDRSARADVRILTERHKEAEHGLGVNA
jgi:hypothetical protein